MFRRFVAATLVSAVVGAAVTGVAPTTALAQSLATVLPTLGWNRATLYTYDGCNQHLCSQLQFVTADPADMAYANPANYSRAAFRFTNTFQDAGDGLGVSWQASGLGHFIGGADWILGIRDDIGFVGPDCWFATSTFRNAGRCLDESIGGWMERPFVPTGLAFEAYVLGPAGAPASDPRIVGSPRPETLQLSLSSVTTVMATPEPATLALVGSGLLALGGVVRRRQRLG